jgi:hypothetical protein
MVVSCQQPLFGQQPCAQMATVPDALQQRVDVACVPKVLETLEHLKKESMIALDTTGQVDL